MNGTLLLPGYSSPGVYVAQGPPVANAQGDRTDALRVVLNAFTSRLDALRGTSSGGDHRRDIHGECGWPKPGEITAEMLQDLYDNNAIAGRVVECLAKASWQQQPQVYEVEDIKRVTPFENGWEKLGRSLLGEEGCVYQDEEGNPIWEVLQRADVLSGIGRYGILLYGIDDGKPLSEPVDGWNESGSVATGKKYEPDEPVGNGTPLTVNKGASMPVYNLDVTAGKLAPGKLRKLLYLQPFPESIAKVVQWESNNRSPRYGRPLMYHVTFNDPNSASAAQVGSGGSTRMVHWTRVEHITDMHHHAGINPWLATPRLQPVLPEVLDIRKMGGATAEGVWLQAFAGMKFTTHAALGGNVDVSLDELREAYADFKNGLDRVLLGRGGDWGMLSPSVTDSSPQMDKALERIAIKIAIPMRILKGSERGNLASEQDEEDWNGTLRGRHRVHNKPKLIAPVTRRLVAYRCVPPPAEGFSIYIPDIATQSSGQKADVLTKRTQAWATYVGSGMSAVVPEKDYATRFDSMTDDEADAMLEKAVDDGESLLESAAVDDGQAVLEGDEGEVAAVAEPVLEVPA